jgi:hypothetical protein
MPICQAIASQHLIRFYYSLGKEPGYRTVEPHMVALTKDDNAALSAWYLEGESASNRGPGWRIYLLDGISQVQILPQTFYGPRDGYQPDGGKSFHGIQCAL